MEGLKKWTMIVHRDDGGIYVALEAYKAIERPRMYRNIKFGTVKIIPMSLNEWRYLYIMNGYQE